MKNAIVLLSGGQDSTTCLYWAKSKFDQVEAIGFDYGQRHSHELIQAQKIADKAKVDFVLKDLKGLLSGSSLLDNRDHSQASTVNKELPASFTPARNLLFMVVAAAYGVNNGVYDYVTGVCQTDYSGYPDCRKVTMDSLQTTLTLGVGSADIRIHTPLMYLDKAETWKLAADLNILEIIIEDTMTDYNGSQTMNEWGMGNLDNPASVLRANGYFKAKENGWI